MINHLNELKNASKKQFFLNLENGHSMPTTIIKGAQEGPTVSIIAGLHSGEYVGVCASIDFVKNIDEKNLKGNLIIIHSLNTTGFYKRSVDVVPEDGINLNGNHPANSIKTYSDNISYFLENEIVKHSDFVIDLHSGSKAEKLSNCIFCPAIGDEDVLEKSMQAALKTDIPKIIKSFGTKGFMVNSARLKTPALLLERSGFGEYKKEDVDGFIHDLRLLLNHFDMYSYDRSNEISKKEIYEKSTYLESDTNGLWYPLKKAGESVKKGELLGYITDFFGNKISEYTALHDGDIYYHTCDLSIRVNDPLYAYGIKS